MNEENFNTESELGRVDIYSDKLNFTTATMQANLGRRVRRMEWDGIVSRKAAPFIFYIPSNRWNYVGIPLNEFILNTKRGGFLAKYTKLDVITPYYPGKKDMMANDWYVIDQDEDLF